MGTLHALRAYGEKALVTARGLFGTFNARPRSDLLCSRRAFLSLLSVRFSRAKNLFLKQAFVGSFEDFDKYSSDGK